MNSTQADKLQTFLRWIDENGSRYPKLSIVTQADGERSMLAKEDISAFQEVVRLPVRLLMTQKQAMATELGRQLQAHAGPVNDEVYLAAFLLEEKQRGDSFWKPYIDILPESFSNVPLFFPDHERALLKGTFVSELLEYQGRTLLTEHAQLCERVPGFNRFSSDAFLWARLAVSSRCFGLLMDGVMNRCMVPLGDMINHQNPPDVIWSCFGDSFVLMAQRPVASGREVYGSYGAKDNDMLLLHYGFVLEKNPDDTLMLRLGLPEGDALAAEKQKLLGLNAPTARRLFKVPAQYDSPATRDMFSFLRIACAGAEEFAQLTATAGSSPSVTGPLSVDTEERVLRALGAACETRLAGFDTTLEEDERLLREGGLTSNARNCIMLRRGEKRLLHAYTELVRTCLPLLRMPAAELEQLAARPGMSWGAFDSYVRTAVLPAVRSAPPPKAGEHPELGRIIELLRGWSPERLTALRQQLEADTPQARA
jgi:histone-lysine N-methyltransferase SETD3